MSGTPGGSERVNPELHALVDSFMELELSDGTLDGENEVPYKLVPQAGVPFDAQELYSRLADGKGNIFYDSNGIDPGWNGFPAHNNNEHTVMDYLNSLLMAVKAEPGCGAHNETRFFST